MTLISTFELKLILGIIETQYLLPSKPKDWGNDFSNPQECTKYQILFLAKNFRVRRPISDSCNKASTSICYINPIPLQLCLLNNQSQLEGNTKFSNSVGSMLLY
ncbi:hypothetical protein DYY65_08765 [Nitrososphaera sp. AFS]|nr:hypothetical protein [Nitrososphaera sp. AFS]